MNKWLKIMAEQTTEGLWDDTGDMVLSEDLSLQPSTVARLHAWNEWHEDYEDYLPPSHRSQPPFPLEAFNAEGRAIAVLIQSELPSWTVVYTEEPLG